LGIPLLPNGPGAVEKTSKTNGFSKDDLKHVDKVLTNIQLNIDRKPAALAKRAITEARSPSSVQKIFFQYISIAAFVSLDPS
jgi:hypothetical protein